MQNNRRTSTNRESREDSLAGPDGFRKREDCHMQRRLSRNHVKTFLHTKQRIIISSSVLFHPREGMQSRFYAPAACMSVHAVTLNRIRKQLSTTYRLTHGFRAEGISDRVLSSTSTGSTSSGSQSCHPPTHAWAPPYDPCTTAHCRVS